MSAKNDLKTLEAAEKAGLRIVIDATEWFVDASDLSKAEREYPLDPEISPARCDLVAEARRLADIVADRPAEPPEGQVYRHSAKRLSDALARAVRHIEKQMKGTANDEPSKRVSTPPQPNANANHDAPNPRAAADAGRARGAASGGGDGQGD